MPHIGQLNRCKIMAKKLYWHKKQDLDVLKGELERDNVVICSTDTIYGFLGNITRNSFDEICRLKGVSETRPFLILVSRHGLTGRLAGFVDMSSISEKTLKFVQKCWPGPVTFLFKAKQVEAHSVKDGGLSGVKGSMYEDSLEDLLGFLPKNMEGMELFTFGGKRTKDFLSAGRETIAIRCPDHEGLQEILINFGGLFSTSANKAGMPAPVKFENIDPSLLDPDLSSCYSLDLDLPNHVNYVVLDQKEGVSERASTIVDLSCPDYSREFPFGLVREGDYSFVALQAIYKSVS